MIKKKYIALALLTGFLYRILISLQGFDHTDVGFSSTFYQNIFTHPEVMPYNYNYYLTGLFGGLWQLVFGGAGLLGFRILEAATLTAAIFFVYKTFERQLNSTTTAAIAILMSFLFPNIVITFHYNTLTFFFMALAAWCYSKAVYQQKTWWVFVAGAVLGICFFARIVNGVLLMVAFIPLLIGVITGTLKTIYRQTVLMLAGMATGSVAVIALMAALGHLSYFITGLGDAFGFFNGMETSHSSTNLFLVYFKGYLNIALQILALFALCWLYIFSHRFAMKWGVCIRFLLIIVTFVLIVTSLPFLTAVALCTLLCCALFYRAVKMEEKALLAFVLACTFLFPFGSDIGIAGIFHWIGGMLIVPAAVGLSYISHDLRRGSVICSIYIAIVMLFQTIYHPYGEQVPRWECTQTIAADCGLNTFVSPQKAADYERSIPTIKKYAGKNPWLVMGNQASEYYYATGLLPFLGNTQMGTYTGNTMLKRLDQQYGVYGQLPVIVFLTQDLNMVDGADSVQAALTRWMKGHAYRKVYSDNYMEIYNKTE